MFKKFLIKQYIKFLKKPGLGKFVNFLGKIAFGKLVFITGYDPQGKEFYKMTNTFFLEKTHSKLKESGCTQLEEYRDFESIDGALFSLAANRRRNS